MKIYTKTGDKGQTSLVGGQRVSKCCDRLESYGTVDELNSHVGVLITYCTDAKDITFLTNIQAALFVLGGYLATDNSVREVRSGNIITCDMVSVIESEIDLAPSIAPIHTSRRIEGRFVRSCVPHGMPKSRKDDTACG